MIFERWFGKFGINLFLCQKLVNNKTKCVFLRKFGDWRRDGCFALVIKICIDGISGYSRQSGGVGAGKTIGGEI